MLTKDLEKFDSDDFEKIPKWVIMRNNSGLQVQLFWETKSTEHESETANESANESKIPKKRSKRKRSPHKIEPIKTEK